MRMRENDMLEKHAQGCLTVQKNKKETKKLPYTLNTNFANTSQIIWTDGHDGNVYRRSVESSHPQT